MALLILARGAREAHAPVEKQTTDAQMAAGRESPSGNMEDGGEDACQGTG
jgi:hypothetical protein